jgi:uncharacterized membrane protein YfcA
VPLASLDLSILALLVLGAAMLYSSGGHAGASAYLALMALYSVAPAVMRPTALVMNIAVATIGTTRFVRARAVPWRLLVPLCMGSIPAAFVGGRLKLSPGAYLTILGGALLVASVFLWLQPRVRLVRPAPPPLALAAIGAVLGFVAGLTGIGGGIFLSPLLLLTGWEEPRTTSGAAAVFILVNSILGLLGQLASLARVPPQALALGATAVAGGLVGSYLGVHRLRPLALRRVHAVVLLISGLKLLYEGWKHHA